MDDSITTGAKGAKIPESMLARYSEVAALIEGFCNEKLDEEYRELCIKALQKLCRKRPSPIIGGKAHTWACGIVYAIGSTNYIFDKSMPLHITGAEISEWFGLSKSTAGNKASEVSRLLKLGYTNFEFQRESLIEQNPMIWLIEFDGFIADVRNMPREIQEIAFRKKLIPYIPADKE